MQRTPLICIVVSCGRACAILIWKNISRRKFPLCKPWKGHQMMRIVEFLEDMHFVNQICLKIYALHFTLHDILKHGIHYSSLCILNKPLIIDIDLYIYLFILVFYSKTFIIAQSIDMIEIKIICVDQFFFYYQLIKWI